MVRSTRLRRTEAMPFALALVGSALIHLGVLFGAEWELPGLHGSDPLPVVDAVLVAARPEPKPAAPVPAPAPRSPRKAERPAPAATAPAPVPVPPAPGFEPPLPAAVPEPPKADATAPPAAPPPVMAEPARSPLPVRGRIRYTVIRGEQGFVVGQSIHEWEHDQATYQVRSVTETTGLAALFKPARVVQTSRGTLDAQGLHPAEFRHERANGTDVASFDRAGRQLAYAGRQEPLPEGTQDMLSIYYQAALTVLTASTLEMPVATGRKLERYRFEPRGEEVLALAGREWRTWRIAAKSGTDLIELWIGQDFRALPLKIRFIDRKGEVFDQVAEAIDIKDLPGASQ